MSKDERPRGLRARLRQRSKARGTSDDEVRSRPMSLDLSSHTQPMLHANGMHSTATIPMHAGDTKSFYDFGYGADSQENSGGLALGEFGEDGSEVAEDEAHTHSLSRPSGAIARSYSQERADQSSLASSKGAYSQTHTAQSPRGQKQTGRRGSSQSVPVYDPVQAYGGVSDGNGSRTDEGESGDRHSGNYSFGYSHDEAQNGDLHSDGDDAEGELNAVYLKRNTDFHGLFRNIPIDELLIDDYICALQRDILVQGRLYLTENYVCFFSNIFGWVTSLTIAFDEIVSIEKKMTALIIPNAIQISTLHAKHAFSSFMYRDSAYNQLYDLWIKSKSEKNAGLPEIGHAEDGTGAGDISRHREDVLNAYQSLTEESDEGSAAGTGSGDDAYSGSEMGVDESDDGRGRKPGGGRRRRLRTQSGFDEESAGSISDTESEGSRSAADLGGVIAAAVSMSPRSIESKHAPSTGRSSMEADTKARAAAKSDSAHDATGGDAAGRTNETGEPGLSTIPSGSSVSPTASQAGTDVTGISQASAKEGPSISRNASQLSAQATRVATGIGAAGTPQAQRSVTSLLSENASDIGKTKALANGATDRAAGGAPLFAKLPKTPDGTDAASVSSLTRNKSVSKKQQDSGSVEAGNQVPLHKPTSCLCGSDAKHTAHYAQEALDAAFPLSLPLLIRLVFSAAIPPELEKIYAPTSKVDKKELDSSCTKRITECGNSDVKTEGWVPDPSDSGLEMCIYSYEKPLGFSIGPKSTTVEDTFRITEMDFDKAVVVEQIVRTPNIPSGTAFFVKIRHCLTWACGPGKHPAGGWSHYRMTFEIEWVKSSWIKGAIEKGTTDSNKQAGEMLEKYIRSWVAAHPSMEVKEQHLGASKALSRGEGSPVMGSAAAAQRRARKAGEGGGGKRTRRRDHSPQGLRMEELLGERDGRRRAEGKGHGRHVGHMRTDSTKSGSINERELHRAANASAGLNESEAAGAGSSSRHSGRALGGGGAAEDESEKKAWRRRADESWVGWASYHAVYPVVCVSRRGMRAARAAVAGPMSGPVVVALLLGLLVVSNLWRLTRDSNRGGVGDQAGGIAEMSGRMEMLAAQVAAINRRLDQLLVELVKASGKADGAGSGMSSV
ncbi:hypothetical protein GGI11_001782 [Coemansia sp. RSA 2049]|nr:hypothetical protein H4217_004527 [Coemansia sp. RSA 1939]KAJ2522255.1 hypothetical protein GGI11_001782 [Coemansia sp. RSA 2049]